ncbi:MAG: hypothetical protein QOE90_73 [Thermoplasmata archaeon]|jgi:hypothetical protein|nr:hypothetical protein [Thermoplasmata archaeon]
MATSRPDLDDATRAFVERQPMFFVASAPLSPQGHVNLSPKGLGTFRVFAPDLVGYLDVGGSGNETSAHVLENGRVTLMFCAFEGAPKVVRLFGRGEVIVPGDARWPEWYARFGPFPGARQIVLVRLSRVGTSCGYGVPAMRLEAQRDILPAKRATLGEGCWYAPEGNRASVDGLPTHLAGAK